MNAEQIDELIDIFERKDAKALWSFAEIKEPYSEEELSKNIISIMADIMKKIEQGDFEHFRSRIYDQKEIVLEILTFSDNVEIKEQIIQEREELKLTRYDVIQIILSINEKEQLKKYVFKAKELGLSESLIFDIIKKIDEPEFTKECIEKSEEIGLKSLWQSSFRNSRIIELIETINDIDFKKKCVKNFAKYNLDREVCVNIICNINDVNFTKECIKSTELNLTYSEKVECIVSLKQLSIDYILDIIMNYKEFGLRNAEVSEIIIQTGDRNLAEECIDKKEELGLSVRNIVTIVLAIEDAGLLKKCLKKGQLKIGIDEIYEMIINFEDKELYKELILKNDEYDLDRYIIRTMIIQICESDFSIECLKNRDKLKLTESDIIEIIEKTKDENLAKSFFELKGEFHLLNNQIYKIIEDIGKKDLVEYCLKKRKELGLSNKEAVILILTINDKDFAQRCIELKDEIELDDEDIRIIDYLTNDEKFNDIELKSQSKIRIPSSMKAGIEIECIGTYITSAVNIIEHRYPEWKHKKDTSVKAINPGEMGDGLEFTPPPLTGDAENIEEQIKYASAVLKTCEVYTNQKCGGHIHIDSEYLSSTQSWKNLLELYMNTEYLLYIIGNQKGEVPRPDVREYASPVSKDWQNILDSGSINIQDEKDIENLKTLLLKIQKGDRYKGINFNNLSEDGIGTIEFRIPNGTIDADVWIANINLFGGLVKAAEDLYQIQKKPEEERSEEEKEKIIAFEKIKNGELSDKEKLEELLKIVIVPEDRHIYQERYEVNSKLMTKMYTDTNDIKDKTATKGITLAKKLFFGEERMTGTDYQEGIKAFKRNEKEQSREN